MNSLTEIAMEILLLIARLLLTAVFGAAGVAKAIDQDGTRRALLGFGIPQPLVVPLGWGLPVIEIIAALALLPLTTAWFGAIAALILLLVFTIAMIINLLRGEAPDCHCFGQLHSEPVSKSTVMRNIVLMIIAGLVILQGKERVGHSAANWLTELKTGEALNLLLMLTGIGLLITAVVLLKRTLGQQAILLAKMEAIRSTLELEENFEQVVVEREDARLPGEGLPIGALAPNFSLLAISDGNRGLNISLDDLLVDGKPVMLFFVSPNCVPCKTLLPIVRVWERDHGDHLTFALLSQGTAEETYTKMLKYGAKYLLQADEKVIEDYRSQWTPAAILVSGDGKIASEITYGDEEIRKMFKQLIASDELQSMRAAEKATKSHSLPILRNSSLLQLGEAVPSFSLPDLHGRMIHTKDLLGSSTLLLFWHPDCTFCLGIFDYLKSWENDPPDGAPKLLYISTGDVLTTRGMNLNLKSPTLLDPGFDIGPLYGARHTPSALLIDEEGKVASSLAVGAQNVLALLGPRRAEYQAAHYV